MYWRTTLRLLVRLSYDEDWEVGSASKLDGWMAMTTRKEIGLVVIQLLALRFPCTYCGVPFGVVCRTPKGVESDWAHAPRERRALAYARHWYEHDKRQMVALVDERD